MFEEDIYKVSNGEKINEAVNSKGMPKDWNTVYKYIKVEIEN